MPAKSKPVHHSVTRHPDAPVETVSEPVVVPAESPVLPPLASDPPAQDSSLRLSAEVESQPVSAPVDPIAPPPSVDAVDPVAQLASLPTSPDFASPATFQTDNSSSQPRKLLWFVVIIFLLAGIGIAGYAVYRLVSTTKTPVTISQVVPSPTTAMEISSPTPVPVLSRSDLKIQVLNGSGTPGLAGEAKEFLEGLGYEEVATGNADAYDVDTTELAFAEAKQTYLDLLSSDLKTKYTLSDQVATLSADSPYDVIVTLGQE